MEMGIEKIESFHWPNCDIGWTNFGEFQIRITTQSYNVATRGPTTQSPNTLAFQFNLSEFLSGKLVDWNLTNP